MKQKLHYCFWVILPFIVISSAFFVSISLANPTIKTSGQSSDPSYGTVTGFASFSKKSAGMPQSRSMDFLLGRAIFKKIWVSSPASTKASDGLGPFYNARSCLSCHPKNGRGRPPKPDELAVSLFLQLSSEAKNPKDLEKMNAGKLAFTPHPVYGGQLQNQAVPGMPAEAHLKVDYQPFIVKLAGGQAIELRKPVYKLSKWGYGKPENLQTSPRLAPQMIGLGLLGAIAEKDILKNADPDDKDGDGISGKASKVWSFVKHKITLGRFGWKASTPSVFEQSSRALSSDIGISNPVFKMPSGDCTKKQADCLAAPNGNTKRDGDLELGKIMNNRLSFYAANLAVPPRRNKLSKAVQEGELLFTALGCAACHKPAYTTGVVPSDLAAGGAHLSNQQITPYSDLLLHDMGKGLADGRQVFNATGQEWRTAPLWGVGLSKMINGHQFFLHDGRARTITEAILWHGGEAQKARDGFAALQKQDRERLIAFVNSL